MGRYAEPRAGEPVIPYVGQASLWVDLIRMLNAWQAGELGQPRRRTAVKWQAVGVSEFADAREAGTISRLSDLRYTADKADPAAVMMQKSTPIFNLEDPVWHDSIDGVFVLPRTVQPGDVVPARNSRLITAKVNFTTESKSSDRYVMVDPVDPTKLKSSDAGIFEIIGDYEVSVGTSDVMVDTTSSQNLWKYELTQDSQAPSDTTAKLLRLDGDEFAESVDLTDELGLTKTQKAGDKGYCFHVGNKFYAVADPEYGGGGGGGQSIEYVIDREYSQGSDNGIWVAIALQVDGGSAENPEDPQTPIVPGGEFLVHDPHNKFPYPVLDASLPAAARGYGVTGSTGWAHLRTVKTSNNIPPDVKRWEIETQSASVSKMRVAIDNCLLYSTSQAEGHFNYEDLQTNASPGIGESWPNVDFPRNVQDSTLDGYEFMITIRNPLNLSAVASQPADQSNPADPSYVWVELNTNQKFSSSNVDTPHNLGANGGNQYEWNVVAVEKPTARWAKIIKNANGQWEFLDLKVRTNFKEGFPPLSNVKDVECASVGGEENCAPEGTEGWAFYGPENNTYVPVSTDSALLGGGTIVTVVNGMSYDESCGITYSRTAFRAFCEVGSTDVSITPNLKEVTVITGVELSDNCGMQYATANIKVCETAIGSPFWRAPRTKTLKVATGIFASNNSICVNFVYAEVCDYNGGKTTCIEICDLLCDCYGNYSQPDFCLPPPPPPCIQTPCNWIWDETQFMWIINDPCPPEVDCYCPEPSYPGTFDGEISPQVLCINDPPPPPPGCLGECDDCTPPGALLRVEELTHTDSSPVAGPACDPPTSQTAFTLLQEISNNGCVIIHDGNWNYQTATGQCSVGCIVTITRSGTTWNVKFSAGTARTLSYTYQGTADCNFFGNIQPGAPVVFGQNATLKVTVECNDETPAPAMQALRRPAISGPVTMGQAFINENPTWFTGCGCKSEVIQVMNRWKAEDDIKDSALNVISRTIANKTQGVDVMAIQIKLRDFITRWFDAEG